MFLLNVNNMLVLFSTSNASLLGELELNVGAVALVVNVPTLATTGLPFLLLLGSLTTSAASAILYCVPNCQGTFKLLVLMVNLLAISLNLRYAH
jgi:hypothetical protein